MTYDGTGSPEELQTILDAYKEHHVHTTFFFLGKRMPPLTETIKKIIEEGHIIGCHAFTHDPLTPQTSQQIHEQFELFLDTLHKISPKYKVKFFRAPYGDIDKRVLKIAAEFELQHVAWTIGSGGLDAKTIQRVVKAKQGDIILSHMFRYYDVSQSSKIVSSLLDKGLTPVTVEEGISPKDNRNFLLKQLQLMVMRERRIKENLIK